MIGPKGHSGNAGDAGLQGVTGEQGTPVSGSMLVVKVVCGLWMSYLNICTYPADGCWVADLHGDWVAVAHH